MHVCDIPPFSCLDRPILAHSFLRRGAAQKRSATFPCKTPGRRGLRRCKTEVLERSIVRKTPALLPHFFARTIHTSAKGTLGRAGRCRGKTCGVVLPWPSFPGARPLSPGADSQVTYGNTPTFVYDQCGVPEPGPQDPRSWVACVVGNSSL